MRIEFSLTHNREDYIWINNLNTLDIICSDGEATEIIVDDILCAFTQQEQYRVVAKLVSKLKSGGNIVIYFTDIEIACRDLTLGSIDLDTFTQAVIQSTPIKSFLETDSIKQILSSLNVVITKCQFKNYTSIIVGEYHV
jgi:hypothetical protein